MDPPRFELLLFSTDRKFVRGAVAAGVDGIVVDWERTGKRRRQAGADTEINQDTLDDLRRVRSCVDVPVLCRINPAGPQTKREVERAIRAGADEVLLPMVRSPSEVERVLAAVRGRCDVGVLVETVDAVGHARELSCLPLSRIYVGLNDLAIERRSHNIFAAVADGTVEQVRDAVTRPFGFAALTTVDRGRPIPCRLVVGELVRLRCEFTFLRRSYRRDLAGGDQSAAVARLRDALAAAAARTPAEVARDRRDLVEAIAAWPRPTSDPRVRDRPRMAPRLASAGGGARSR